MMCSTSIEFCCAHRIFGHEGRCANLHGHNYQLTLFAQAQDLDALGRVVDFSILKGTMTSWIDDNWDHNLLVYEKDLQLMKVKDGLISIGKPFVCIFNPTAENMADFLINQVCPKIFSPYKIKILKIELSETTRNKVVVKARG